LPQGRADDSGAAATSAKIAGMTKHRLAIVIGFLAAIVGVVLGPLLAHLKVDSSTSAIILGAAFPAILAKVGAFVGKDASAVEVSTKAVQVFFVACGLVGPVLAWASPHVHWLGASSATGGFVAMLLSTWSKQATVGATPAQSIEPAK
jgi:hypothetical protein